MNQDNRPECKVGREEKLKPCPFCGSEKAMFDRNESRAQMGYYEIIVECQNCFAASGYCKTKKEALNQWNTRHTEQPEGWVSVEEDPIEGQVVDVWDQRLCCRIPDVVFQDGEYASKYMSWSGDASHWQPLPKPPEEE